MPTWSDRCHEMRFKAAIQNTAVFTKFTASLASIGNVAWVRLNNDEVRFTIIPERGTQVWAVLSIDTIFSAYLVQSAAPDNLNTINLEVPLQPLLRALRSASQATSASIRLTKKDDIPLLSLTIVMNSFQNHNSPLSVQGYKHQEDADNVDPNISRERETHITQEIPIRVLSADSVTGLHEPRSRDPDVHIVLPPLAQLKNVSDRFTKLALDGLASSSSSKTPKLELSASMHGELRLSLATPGPGIETLSSIWRGLANPDLDPSAVEDIDDHPSTRMRAVDREDAARWATVRIDAKDWGKVMSVGRLAGSRVIACFVEGEALILYVYLDNAIGQDGEGEGSVLTYYVSSYSA